MKILNMWKDRTVLVVEDDKISTELFGEILNGTDVTVLYATEGESAIDICRNRHVDIVLMDIQLPGMSGYSAFLEIKKLNEKIVVIAQTAFAMSGDREKYMTLGFDDYIAKPIYPKDLLGLLSKYIDNK